MSSKYSNFELKYLKYKSKYLTLKKSMKGGVGDYYSRFGVRYFKVKITLPDDKIEILEIPEGDFVYPHILNYLKSILKSIKLNMSLIKITYNKNELTELNQSKFTAEKYSNDSNSNSNKPEIKVEYIPVNTKKQVNDLITYIYMLNSSVTKRINYINATYENDKLYDLVFDRKLNDNSKLILPESFGYIHMAGSLNLSKNNIESLPNSFGNIKIGKDLSLAYNNLTKLPESFGDITVGGNLFLAYNKLTTLPESFGNIKVGGNLTLDNNKLTTLPESFGNIKVGGKLTLDNNKLTTVPITFKNVEGTISLPISMAEHFKGNYKHVFN